MYTRALVTDNQPDQVVYYGSSRNTTLEGLTPGFLYTYKVKATNKVGDGPWSAEYSFLIVNEPSQPLNPRIVDFSN